VITIVEVPVSIHEVKVPTKHSESKRRVLRKIFSRYESRSRGANATWEGAAGQYATPNDFVVRLQRKRFSRYEPRSCGANATWGGAATNATPPNDIVRSLPKGHPFTLPSGQNFVLTISALTRYVVVRLQQGERSFVNGNSSPTYAWSSIRSKLSGCNLKNQR